MSDSMLFRPRHSGSSVADGAEPGRAEWDEATIPLFDDQGRKPSGLEGVDSLIDPMAFESAQTSVHRTLPSGADPATSQAVSPARQTLQGPSPRAAHPAQMAPDLGQHHPGSGTPAPVSARPSAPVSARPSAPVSARAGTAGKPRSSLPPPPPPAALQHRVPSTAAGGPGRPAPTSQAPAAARVRHQTAATLHGFAPSAPGTPASAFSTTQRGQPPAHSAAPQQGYATQQGYGEPQAAQHAAPQRGHVTQQGYGETQPRQYAPPQAQPAVPQPQQVYAQPQQAAYPQVPTHGADLAAQGQMQVQLSQSAQPALAPEASAPVVAPGQPPVAAPVENRASTEAALGNRVASTVAWGVVWGTVAMVALVLLMMATTGVEETMRRITSASPFASVEVGQNPAPGGE